MTIQRKMQLLSLIVLIGFLLVIAGTFNRISQLDNATNAYTLRSNQIRQALEIKASALATIQLDPAAPQTLIVFSDAEHNIRFNGSELQTNAKRPAAQAAIQQILTLWQQYDQDSQSLLNLAKTDARGASDQVLPLYKKEFLPLQSTIEDFVIHARQDADTAQADMQRNQNHLLWLVTLPLIALGTILIAFVTHLTRSLAHTLQHILQGFKQLGTGQLTTRLPTTGHDELTTIAHAVNTFVQQTQTIVHQVQDNAQHVSTAASQLASAAAQIALGSNQQNQAAAIVASSVEQMSVSINHVSSNANDALNLAQSANVDAHQGNEIIHNTTDKMHVIGHVAATAAAAITHLDQQSQHITTIAQTIQDIAGQTQQLTHHTTQPDQHPISDLDNVHHLTERTAHASQDIAAAITQIQTSTDNAIQQMRSVIHKINDGKTLASQASEHMASIQHGVEGVMVSITEISTALSQQSAASYNIAANIERIAQMTEENSNAAQATAQAAQHLDQVAQAMRATVHHFKV